MLRHYDERGLLAPKITDSFTGYRYYSEEQLAVAGRIVALKDMGFSLSAIGEMLKSYDDPKALAEFLAVQRTQMQSQANDAARRVLLLEAAIKRLREDDKMMKYDVVLKTIPERYVASVRKVIPAYDKEGELWGIMMSETAAQSMKIADPCYGLAVFHDEGFKESDVDVEVQMSVEGKYNDTNSVKFKTVAPVEIASATYKGSYEQLTDVHRAVANWVRDNGYEFTAPMFCIYHVSPAQTNNPDELVTEVCYPVKKM